MWASYGLANLSEAYRLVDLYPFMEGQNGKIAKVLGVPIISLVHVAVPIERSHAQLLGLITMNLKICLHLRIYAIWAYNVN